MRLRLVLTVGAVLALAACGDRQASKTETAARTSIGPATSAACPPQPAPACPPAAEKFPAKASTAVSHRRAKAGKAAQRRTARARPRDESAWQDRYAGPGRPIPYEEYYARDDDYGRGGRYEEQRRYYDRYTGPGTPGQYGEGERDGRAWGYQGRGYGGESYYESGSSSYREAGLAGPCCTGSSVGAAGFDGRGYLTWPGKVPAR